MIRLVFPFPYLSLFFAMLATHKLIIFNFPPPLPICERLRKADNDGPTPEENDIVGIIRKYVC